MYDVIIAIIDRSRSLKRKRYLKSQSAQFYTEASLPRVLFPSVYSLPPVNKGKIHLKCNSMVNINLLDFFEILGISCCHQGKIWDKILLGICHGVSELWLSKALSFPHARKNSHVHISGDINAMTMKHTSLKSS